MADQDEDARVIAGEGSGEGNAAVPSGGEGQGLADVLAGREPGDEGSHVFAGGSGQADAGSPGGMGGVRGGMPNPDHRPNGGVSPIQPDGTNGRD